MFFKFILFSIFVFPLLCVSLEKSRTVGAVWNLNGMAECKLRVPATDYNDYGCYCGLGGAGTPVDGIDECCMHHDQCYDKIIKSDSCPSVYTLPYLYSCTNNQPTCMPNQDSCKTALCQCDKTLVDCWAKYPIPEDKATCPSTDGLEAKRNLVAENHGQMLNTPMKVIKFLYNLIL